MPVLVAIQSWSAWAGGSGRSWVTISSRRLRSQHQQNLHGPVQNENMEPLIQTAGVKKPFPFFCGLSTCHGVSNLPFNVVLPQAQGYLRGKCRPLTGAPGPHPVTQPPDCAPVPFLPTSVPSSAHWAGWRRSRQSKT